MNEDFLKYLEENKEQISLDKFIQSVEETERLCEFIFFSQNIMRLNHHIYCWIFDQELQNYFYRMCYNSFLGKDKNSLLRVFNVLHVNYNQHFLRENLLKRLFNKYHENNEFIDFICKFDIQLSQDKIIRDYILDADNNNLPEELEGKFIEHCLDNENFDALNKYLDRNKQRNIDIVMKILNSGHDKAFPFVQEHGKLYDIIDNIRKRLEEIENDGIKYKVMVCFEKKFTEKYRELHVIHRDLQLTVERQCRFYVEMKEKVEEFIEEIKDLNEVNSELLKQNNKLLKDQYMLKELYRKTLSSLQQAQEKLNESEKRSEEVLTLDL